MHVFCINVIGNQLLLFSCKSYLLSCWQRFLQICHLAGWLSDCGCCCFNSCFYCLCRSLLLLCTAKFTRSSWLSHKVNSDVSTRSWQTSLPHSGCLDWLHFLGNQDTDEATENVHNRIRRYEKEQNPKMLVWMATMEMRVWGASSSSQH